MVRYRASCIGDGSPLSQANMWSSTALVELLAAGGGNKTGVSRGRYDPAARSLPPSRRRSDAPFTQLAACGALGVTVLGFCHPSRQGWLAGRTPTELLSGPGGERCNAVRRV